MSFCFCFIFGVGIFSLQSFDQHWQFFLYIFLFIIGFGLIVFWSNIYKRFWLVCLLFFILGGLRFYLSIPGNSIKNLSYYNGRVVSFVATISSLIDSGGINTSVIAKAQRINNVEIAGGVLLFVPPYMDLKYGDTVQLTCQLQAPQNTKTFLSYDKYLARNGVWSTCNWPKIEKINSSQNIFNKIVIFFFNFRTVIQNKVNNLWPEPESALMAGLLYGAGNNFSAEVKNDFSITGITHIVAISGYNIGIVVIVFMNSLLGLGMNRRRAFYFSGVGIILFVLFTGASASVVRAGVMGVIVLLSTQWGRLSQIGNVLVFTAALMLLSNPFVLIWDVGFQLSFLATIGLVYFSPVLKNYWPDNPHRILLNVFKDNFITTMSAIIITLPLILFQFGRLSVVAPLANVLVLWIIPYLMLFGFMALVLGFIFYPLAQVIAWLSYFGLKYVIITAHYLAHWPMTSIDFSIPLWLMFVIYIFLIYLVSRRAS